MPSKAQGSIHLFRVKGIDLFLHWSWFVVAIFEIRGGMGTYSSVIWNVLEYLALFLIVLLHEFGHAFACRSVGGVANRILLWPFGGVAYVNPPQRPGAMLWSIAAGPLVNVVLFPLLLGVFLLAKANGWSASMHDEYVFVRTVLWIDLGLLIFNMMPVYPLDGGQILRSLLWFVLGRGRSLMVATILGFVGIVGFFVLAAVQGSFWLAAIGVFMLLNCWGGLQHARQLLKMAKLPRRPGYACPSCRTAPPIGEFWGCRQCGKSFDTFETRSVCPHCSAQYMVTTCLDCGVSRPQAEWVTDPVAASGAVLGSSAARS